MVIGNITAFNGIITAFSVFVIIDLKPHLTIFYRFNFVQKL